MKRLLVRLTSRLGLAVWFAAMMVVGTTLLVRHLLALPRVRTAHCSVDGVPQSASRRGPLDDGARALHAECRCSQRIADHLTVATLRPTDVSEHVLLVGTDEVPRVAGLNGRIRLPADAHQAE